MQPTFLPWAGYFRLMNAADHFVYLDDVQLARQSWQTRNRIFFGNAVHWIVVPIVHAGLDQVIAETQLVEGPRWRRKLGRSLAQGYSRTPHASAIAGIISIIEAGQHEYLADFNIALIEHCAERLGIAVARHRSSRMSISADHRSDRLTEICGKSGCDTYISPVGSAEYLTGDKFTERSSLTLEFFRFDPPTYPQHGTDNFVSHLSIVDLVANVGWSDARDYIRAV
jgi:hypothetical protein